MFSEFLDLKRRGGRQSFWGWRLELELQPAKSKSQGFGPLIIARAPPTPPTSSGGTNRRTIKPKLGFTETDIAFVNVHG
jgi:hypothetical protein